mmetsp:Transcript_12597/g.25676  ORF Transcript_12597/g.25676 Transcript_12597/m.25676 type:complete len:263 (-) Transcript_12597:240-1028(-)
MYRSRTMVLLLRSRRLLCYILLLAVSLQTKMRNVESFAVSGNLHSPSMQQESRTRLCSADSGDDAKSNGSANANGIRFLGRGANAIVRPGVVLLAPAEEFHHYLRQSAVFIYSMGLDDDDEYVVRGVILDNPTPFNIGEMMEVKTAGGIFENLIYRGGESGGQEAVFCLHSVEDMGLEEIGTSRVYQGGDLERLDGKNDPSRVKFFFNYMEFLEQELEDMLEIIHDDGDGWTSVEVPPEIVLDNDCDKSEAWSRLRNAVRGK